MNHKRDDERCACSPWAPCGVHWSALDDHGRRQVARRLGFRLSQEAEWTPTYTMGEPAPLHGRGRAQRERRRLG
jgi:hypothetical protein